MQKSHSQKAIRKAQHQQRPGIESKMSPLPKEEKNEINASHKLAGKTAVITGGDSGIGKAVALLFAKEGADVAIIYLEEDSDAKDAKMLVEGLFKKLATHLAKSIYW
jgi:5,10-methylene-tetrahydrofolate dehydrogenase/methenyl tetrahydrofolate cyclohydrolase